MVSMMRDCLDLSPGVYWLIEDSFKRFGDDPYQWPIDDYTWNDLERSRQGKYSWAEREAVYTSDGNTPGPARKLGGSGVDPWSRPVYDHTRNLVWPQKTSLSFSTTMATEIYSPSLSK
jgi:hypothetical protein